MKEREPLNLASTSRAPPVGRPWTILGGGIFNRNYAEISTGVDRCEVPDFSETPPTLVCKLFPFQVWCRGPGNGSLLQSVKQGLCDRRGVSSWYRCEPLPSEDVKRLAAIEHPQPRATPKGVS